jgi:hypothetical protein
MGYYSQLRGKLTITSSRAYPQSVLEAAAKDGYELPALMPLTAEQVAFMNDGDRRHYGQLTVTAYDVTSTGEAFTVHENMMDELVADIRNFGGVVNGELIRIGEEQGDLERYFVENNEVFSEFAELVWADNKTPVPREYYQR